MQRRESNGEGRVQVVIAENTEVHSQLLANALKRDRRIHVVGSVSTSRELLDLVAKFPVDVAVINSAVDDDPSQGFALLREIRRTQPSVCGVMLLDSCKRRSVVEAFRAGARGVFSESASYKSLGKCIRCVHEGQIWAGQTELKFALDALASAPSIRAVNAQGMNLLSKRESEVVHALAGGLTNREIGQQLGLSRHTIKNYLLRIFDKVGVSTRMELLFLTLSEPEGRVSGAAGDFPRDGCKPSSTGGLLLPSRSSPSRANG
jgi:DNA-binding NarL/FixJ family response regulator